MVSLHCFNSGNTIIANPEQRCWHIASDQVKWLYYITPVLFTGLNVIG